MKYSLLVLFVASLLFASTAHAGTNVGGILALDTIWEESNSPYIITDTVQIPWGVTLTIEPGVIVQKPSSGDMFLINGILRAHGTNDNTITFDGGDNSDFFSITGSISESAFLDLNNCIIKDGLMFWPGGNHNGQFSLRNSVLTNLAEQSCMWFPAGNVDIYGNKFINTYGFRIFTDHTVKVHIENNFFYQGHTRSTSGYWNFYILVDSQNTSEVVITKNTFVDMCDIILRLSDTSINTFTAAENYWGTQNVSVVESMIYDRNDTIECGGYIDYTPILTESHPDTPVLNNEPQIVTTSLSTATEDMFYSDTITVEDPDNGDILTFHLVTAPYWLSIDQSGSLSGTPENSDVGTDIPITIKVTDSFGDADTLHTTINVINTNDEPIIVHTPLPDAIENGEYEEMILVNDPDIHDAHIFELSIGPDWLSIDGSGVLSGIPGTADVGSDIQITIKVTDSGGLTDSITKFINVLPGTINAVDRNKPLEFALHNVYPNPFNPSTNIEYTIASDDHVLVKVYNANGQFIQTLVNEFQQSGLHVITWNASEHPGGLYFCTLQVHEFIETSKMILIK